MRFESERWDESSTPPDETTYSDYTLVTNDREGSAMTTSGVVPHPAPPPPSGNEQIGAMSSPEMGVSDPPVGEGLGQLAIGQVADSETSQTRKRMGPPPKLPPELLALALDRYATSTATVTEIAEELGVSAKTLQRAAAVAGLDPRPGGARKGVSRPQEVRRRISEAQKGREFSETHRRRLSASTRRRWRNAKNVAKPQS